MATCKRCNRALYDKDVAEFGPLCPECKAAVEEKVVKTKADKEEPKR